MKCKNVGRKLAALFVVVVLIAAIGCSAADQTFTGILEQTETGLVLNSSEGANTYRVIANPDVLALLGKSVKLTGNLLDRQAGKTIEVKSFEVLK
jgi:hypothetical protein